MSRTSLKGVLKPFKRVIRANIGDCHALGQRPITFIRQVLALATCPGLRSLQNIPEDVKERVREILGECVYVIHILHSIAFYCSIINLLRFKPKENNNNNYNKN